MKPLRSVAGIKDAYTRRILSNIVGVDALRVYAATPARLRALTRGLSRKQIHSRGPRGEWPISHVLSHLCDAEWVGGYRIRMIVAQPGRKIQAYDQDAWADGLHYGEGDWREKLELFEALRRSHVRLLKTLSPAEWRRYGLHEERGKESVARTVQMLAGHDVNHLRQIKKLRARLLRRRGA